MRKGLLAALAGAAALGMASQAAAATFAVDFEVTGPFSQLQGSSAPFGLTDASVLTGTFTGDTDLLTSAPGPFGGTEMLTDLQFTVGPQTFTLSDIAPASSWVQIVGGDVIFGLDLGVVGVSNNNFASFSDGANTIGCAGCVTDTRLEWSGLGSPTPEPDSWAIMLLGFFGLGAAMRGRRRAAAA